MNGKQAKMLRRHAEDRSRGEKMVEYKANVHRRIDAKTSRVYNRVTLELTDHCTRKIYKELKKEFKVPYSANDGRKGDPR
jgi:hypothetical protein